MGTSGAVVGLVEECEAVSGKDKLKKLLVDVGTAKLQIVTNAPNVEAGVRVVLAPVGTTVRGEEVKRAVVGGVPSEGMLCDAPMLGWTGGGSGAAALVPDSFSPGDAPPARRPRMDGGGTPSHDHDATALQSSTVEPLFAKKLSKEEKKAQAAARKAEREAKKAANAGAVADAASPAADGGDVHDTVQA